MANRFHCCATCTHFSIRRNAGKIETKCTRLGYETKTFYQFQCWQPRPDIVARMQKEEKTRRPSS